MSNQQLAETYAALQREATRLAGGLTDLAQRAMVYHHLYVASRGAHVFPLIAAHGALWAGAYFRFGLRLGRWLSWQYGGTPDRRREQLRRLDQFADAFRDVNRRVCVDTYANFHFTARFGQYPAAAEFVAPTLLEALNRVHAAVRSEQVLTDDERRSVFTAHFLNEQQTVVGPALSAAVEAFDWPVMQWIALRPWVRFAYFPRRHVLRFHNFADRQERIENGLTAFDWGAEVGWQTVEQALDDYCVLPGALFLEPVGYFARLRSTLLMST